MRAFAMMAPAFLVLAGCAAPDDVASPASPAAPAGLVGFDAVYKVRFEGTDGGDVEQTLDLRLEAPRVIFTSSGLHRAAYPLTMEMQGPTGGISFHEIYYLDGDLRIVRHDTRCGFGFSNGGHGGVPDCFSKRRVSFQAAGYIPPLGLWLADLAEGGSVDAPLHGTDRDVPVTHHDGRLGLAPGYPAPFEEFLDASARYEYGSAGWLPQAFTSSDMVWGFKEVHGTLSSVTLGGPLPEIEPWPRNVLGGTVPTLKFGFPAMDETFWGLDATWREAFAALAAISPAGADAMASGCLVTLFSSGYNWEGLIPSIMYGADATFMADIVDGEGTTQRFHWRYREDALPDVDGDPTGTLQPYAMQTEHEWEGMPQFCEPPPDVGFSSITRTLERAWQLPLDRAGYPCAIEFRSNPLLNQHRPLDRGDSLFLALLTHEHGAPGNTQEGGWSYEGWVAGTSVRTGEWGYFVLPEPDWQRLESPGFETRPLPVAPQAAADPTAPAPFRCIGEASGES